jgi:hypothetical protein
MDPPFVPESALYANSPRSTILAVSACAGGCARVCARVVTTVLALLCALVLPAAAAPTPSPARALPLAFEPNQGQADPAVRFLTRGRGYGIFLTPTEAVMVLTPGASGAYPRRPGLDGVSAAPPAVVRMRLVGADPRAAMSGAGELPGRHHYFRGGPEHWRRDVPTFARVHYAEVYPGVGLVFYGHEGELEYDFVVAPGADPGVIELAFEGVRDLRLDGAGDLVVATATGDLRLRRPVVYQDTDDGRRAIEGAFRLDGDRVRFRVAAWDRTRPLVIDPVLGYSTYLGGSATDQGLGIAVDSAGNAYVTGSTISSNFPVATTAPQRSLGGDADVFVAKVDPSGSALLYATFLGGSGADVGQAIAVDGSGNAYLTGMTTSNNFPVVGAFQPTTRGGAEVFVAKLAPSGSSLVYSTYLGSNTDDFAFGIAVDGAGNAYVTGATQSATFPDHNAITCQGIKRTGPDAFVARVDPTGGSLGYCRFLGGAGIDVGQALAADTAGNVWVAGSTTSADLPVVSALQATPGGGTDAFVGRLDPTGAVVYLTYLGGTGDDEGLAVAIDTTGNTYVTGLTASTDFPTMAPLQPASGGGLDAFVTKLDPAGAALVFSTYLGGGGDDLGNGIGVHATDLSVYVAGSTASTNFPTLAPLQPARAGGLDAFAAKLNAAGSALVYATYLGGTADDAALSLAVDADGVAYLTGSTRSSAFPTARPLRGAGGGLDAFVTQITEAGVIQFSAATYSVGETGGSITITVQRVGDLGLPATVQFATGDGTATAGLDYDATSGTLTFGVGQSTATFSITVRIDTICDGDETVNLTLSDPGGGSGLGQRKTAVLTLVESRTCINFSAPAYQVSESRGPAVVTVARSGSVGAPTTVTFATSDGTATAPADYTAVTDRTLTFAAGVRSVTVPIPIVNDGAAEGAETVNLTLTAVDGGLALGVQSRATLTILDDDVRNLVQFSAPTYQVNESGGSISITVQRTGDTRLPATVQFATSDGTAAAGEDYAATSGLLSFAAGQGSRTFTVTILPDALCDGDETVNLTLSSPDAGSALGRRTAVLTIVEASACINFAADASQVLESRGPATVTVARSGPLVGTVTVQFSSADGTATAPADYAAVTRALTFATGVRSVNVTIPIVNDRLVEGTETVSLALTSVQGAATLGTRAAVLLEILDDDVGGAVQFGAASYTVAEAAGTALITVTRTGSTAGGATVQYSTSDGTAAAGADYTAITSGTLTFAVGESTKTFPVAIVSDATAEGVETVNLTLSSPGPNTTTTLGVRTTAVLRIVDDELSVQLGAPTYTVRESAGSASITVELTGVNTTPVTVTWTASPGTATAGSDYGTLGSVTPPSGTLTFPRGGTPTGVRTLTFPVRILQDRLIEDTETVNLVLSNAAGGAALGSRTTATLAIQDDDLGGAMQLSATTYTVAENVGAATITVTRSGSTAGDATVRYATSNGTALGGTDFTETTGTLTFLTNETTKTFTVPITDDATPEGFETFTVTLSNPGPNATSTLGARTTATVRVVDDEPALAFSAAASSVREAAGSATVMVELTGVNTTPITVRWDATDGTATLGADYGTPGAASPLSGTLTFSPGGTPGGIRTRTFSVRILQDTVVEDAETITLALSNPVGAALVDDRAAAALVIVDDEPSLAFSAATSTVSEAVATAMVTVEVAGVNTAPLVVTWTTSDDTATAGLDYGTAGVATPPSGTITFPVGGTPTGVRTRTFPVRIIPDRLVEGAETVNLAVSSPGARLVTGRESATLSITDDDTGGMIQFNAASTTVAESVGTARITVVRSGSTAGGATVRYEADGGTATFVDDYGTATGTPTLTGTLTFGVGETTKVIDVPIVNDTLPEGVETVIVTLTAPGPNTTTTLGPRATTVLRIVDSELALAFSAPAYSVREAGGSATITVELTGVNTTPVTVTWTAVPDTATAGSDYGTAGSGPPPSGTLTFSPGGTPTGVRTRTFTVRILPDTLLEGPEALTLTLSNPTGAEIAAGHGTAVLTILDDDVAGVMEFSALVFNATECAAPPCHASLTVSRTGGAASQVTVDFITEDGTAIDGVDYTATTGTVTFGASQASQTIRIPLLVEPGANPLRTFSVRLQNPSVGAGLGARSLAEVRLTDPR